MLLYATARRGYKAGSFNLLSTREDLTTYDPEIAQDMEVGAKTDFRLSGIPFRLNLAAFRTNYKSFQASSVLIEANGNINVLTLNREPVTSTPNNARIKGFEAELTVSPASWLQLSGFYSTIKAKYTQFLLPSPIPGFPPAANLANTNISGVIPRTFGTTAEINVPLNSLAERLRANVSYYSTAAPLQNLAVVPTQAPKRQALDARVGLSNLFQSGVDVAVFGKNITDFNKCTINQAVSGEPTCLYGEPRTYGLELTFRFGGK